MGEMTLEQVRDWHRQRAKMLRGDSPKSAQEQDAMADAIDAHLAQAGEAAAWEDPTGFSIAMVKDEAKNWTSRSTGKQMLLNYAASMEALAHPRPAVPDGWLEHLEHELTVKRFADNNDECWRIELKRLVARMIAAPESGGG